MRKNKFNAKKVNYRGMTFDSQGEFKRYLFLLAEQDQGHIKDLKRQVPFKFNIDGKWIFTYKADHVYKLPCGKEIIEDFKGAPPLPIFKLKAKLLKAKYGLNIVIVRKINEKIL